MYKPLAVLRFLGFLLGGGKCLVFPEMVSVPSMTRWPQSQVSTPWENVVVDGVPNPLISNTASAAR